MSHISSQTIQSFIEKGAFYLIHVIDQTKHMVYDITGKRSFVIVDEEQLRKVVKACVAGCACGYNEYVIPQELVEQMTQAERTRDYGLDYDLVQRVLSEIGGSRIKEGDWVHYRQPYYEGSGSRLHYPTSNQLVHVTHVYYNQDLGTWVLVGLTRDNNGRVITVEGECWRFTPYDVSTLSVTTNPHS